MLENRDFAGVINAGYNVFTYDMLEQIKIEDQLNIAIEKHLDKYRSKQ